MNIRTDSVLPRSLLCFRQYSLSLFASDVVAGLTVGLVALPLAMAFAISSGVAPESGLYCAIIACFLISALGGSRTQIGGPTGAFVVVVSGIVATYGMDGLYMCTMMAGVLLVILGITGLGSAVKFIPRAVVIGFTNGIALLIASTQIKDFFGLSIAHVPGEFLGRMEAIAENWQTLSMPTTCVSAGTLALILILRRYAKRVPGTIVALFLGTLVVWLFDLPLETIQSRFGGIPSGLPKFTAPSFRPDLVLKLLSPTLTVTMLGAIESLLSAVVADRMSKDKHNPNTELVAQGIANLLSPLAGGLPATGAIARTATNIRSGAKTPVAGMLHAVVVLLILLFAAPLAGHIPLCVLAAILVVVAYNMGEWHEVPEMLRLPKSITSVWLVTLGLTVFADLTVAVEAGMIMAVLLYIRQVTRTTTVSRVSQGYIEEGKLHILQNKNIPPEVAIFRIHGPFLFGCTDKLATITGQLDDLPEIVIIRLRNMTALDSTGLHALESVVDQLQESRRRVLFCGMREQPLALMRQAHFDEHLEPGDFCQNVHIALDRAQQIIAENIRRRRPRAA